MGAVKAKFMGSLFPGRTSNPRSEELMIKLDDVSLEDSTSHTAKATKSQIPTRMAHSTTLGATIDESIRD